MIQKDPAEPLQEVDLEEFVEQNREFDRWLKREKKISNYPNAKYDREKRRKTLENIITSIKNPTLTRIADELALRLQDAESDQLEVLQDIKQFFEQRLGVRVPLPEEAISTETVQEEPATAVGEAAQQEGKGSEIQWIGRVAPTLRSPSTPAEFTFWVGDNENIHIEVGSLVTAHNRGVRVTGLVTDIQAVSDVREVLDSFYAHAFGRPEVEMPTRIPVVVSARAEVVRRSDGRMEPIRGTWPVTFASAKEIREAYVAQIPEEHEVLAGFTYDNRRDPVPIGLDARYVVGYEAAHINISGASGVATKTSYALFLLYALLAHSEKHNSGIAAIAFNVKEADLMFIDKVPTWEELRRLEDHPRWGPSVRLWRQAKEDYGLDPVQWAKGERFRFFAPMHFQPGGGVLSQRSNDVEKFNYSLQSLIKAGVGALYAIFDPDDLDEKAVALIASMADLAKRESLTFESLIREVRNAMQQGRSRGDWFVLDGMTHHRATANKILNRLQHALENQLKGVVLKAENTDCPIPLEELRPGRLWVVDITQLSDKGQRLIFQTVVRTVFRLLEKRKAAEISGRWEDPDYSALQQFPRHVVIFVDELNKFVPAGREFSVLKGDIVEIAARGRSVGLSLLGAQQLASKVDEEVLANTSTFAVGRSHPVEIRKPPYGWLAEGLKQKATLLDKGWMLLWHTLHNRPVLVHFPIPLHHLKKEIGT
ncbi:MAG TPA: ATP-binding protein [Candidatus Acetothermia bacterium]|nr:ATP-binding protein [Candidatus Acetothermia bacterium]